ncbi:MAG TPA: hypothetical protein VNT26_04650 [Candidatus Sulfotelmatobacter sp.]|nr:hypothetical protein [Candidatus Sulfotelmatobacter sp.]
MNGAPGFSLAGIIILGGLALWVAFKAAKFLFKLVFGLIGLALLGIAAWWFLLPH